MSTFLSSSFGTGFTRTGLHEDSHGSEALDPPPLDIGRLKDENLRLREDLVQCQVDKEFVWSLWKKLQVASPDVTEAVALVVEREKQKAEDKDRKVLDILKLKDEKIIGLQRTLDQQSQELDFINHKKLESQDDAAHHRTENARLVEELTELRCRCDEDKSRQQENHDGLMSTIDQLTGTCQKLQEELSASHAEVDRVTGSLQTAEDETKLLNEEVRALQASLDTVFDKEGKLTNLINKYEGQVKKITAELKSKTKRLDATRRELSDLWTTHHQCQSNAQQREDIIRQLEDLQLNTENMLRDSEGAHLKLTDQQHQMQVELHKELTVLREKEQDQSEQIRTLRQTLKIAEEEKEALQLESVIVETDDLADEKWRSKLYNMERENEQLREKLHDKNRVIDRLSKRTDIYHSDFGGEEPRGDQARRKHVRSKSESGLSLKEQDMVKRCTVAEAKLEQTEIRLHLKDAQLEALKQAHKRRLTRLKNLLTSYKLVREQLKVAEDELGRPPKKKKPVFKRPSKKLLQQEDNDAAWNELRFTQNENKNLHIIRMNLEEQLDDMAVKASEDASSLHTLQLQVDTLEEELNFMRRQGRNVSSTPRKQEREDLAHVHAKLASCQSVIDSQQVRIVEISRDNTVLTEEKRTLKFEMNTFKKSLYEKEMEMADLHGELKRIKRVSRRNHRPSRTADTDYTSELAQRYEDVLRNSVNSMNAARVAQSQPYSPPHESIEAADLGKRRVRVLSAPLTRSRTASSSLRRLHAVSPLLRRAERSVEEERAWASEPEYENDLGSETVSELDSMDNPQTIDSAMSLGEVIARRATTMEVEDTGCQTSPRLLHSLQRHADTVMDRAEPDTLNKMSVRDIGTCTVPRRHRGVRHSMRRPSKSNAFTQVSSLKQRLVSLQLKVKSLTELRDQSKAQADELIVTCEKLQSQINNSDTKMVNQRTNIQRLDHELTSANARVAMLESTVEQSVPRQQAEQEKRVMEQRLKTATQDLTRRSADLKQVKSELEKTKESNSDLTDRLTRLERDVSQKRTLLEELRLKLRLAKETAKEELQMLESRSEAMERYKAIAEQNKSMIDSMKNSIKALTKEKKEHERKCKESQRELTKQEKQLAACQVQNQSLQQEMDSLQETARQQLVNLAAQGENAVGVAQSQLVKAHRLIEQFQLLLKHLSDALLARHDSYRLERQRQVREEKQRVRRESSRKVDSDALNHAKKRAQEILNLSASDIEDLLNSDPSSDEDDEESFSSYWKRDNSRWVKKWEKALASENFIKRVSDLFIEKIEDIYSLAR